MRRNKILILLFIFLSNIPVFAQVDTAWVRRYNGPGNGYDNANALAVDGSGNVYVTGQSTGSGSGSDYATIKYAPNGDTTWVRRYNGPGNSDDIAEALVVDDSQNVYVTGSSVGSGTSEDFATIKYSPNGATLWIRRYNGPGNASDRARAMKVDGNGNVYITGFSYGSGTFFDYATIKYAPNGDTVWVRRYDGTADTNDVAYDLAIDWAGNVYVTGYSVVGPVNLDYTTIRYAPNGNQAWVRSYEGPGSSIDWANAVKADSDGNVYVTGLSFGSGTSSDIATIKYASNGSALWVKRYGGINSDEGRALAIDEAGNVYVAGSRYTGGGDYATIKYFPNGDTAWVRHYNGVGNGSDNANALAVDSAGNVYVTGYSYAGITSNEYTTIKYSPDGETLWVKSYNGPGNYDDVALALTIDDGGNIYVTGLSWSATSADYATIKYTQCSAKPGDTNGDGSVTLPDIIFLVNRVFKGGPPTSPLCRGDANADGSVTLPDIIYLVNRVFKGGPAPLKSKECCL